MKPEFVKFGDPIKLWEFKGRADCGPSLLRKNTSKEDGQVRTFVSVQSSIFRALFEHFFYNSSQLSIAGHNVRFPPFLPRNIFSFYIPPSLVFVASFIFVLCVPIILHHRTLCVRMPAAVPDF